MMVIEGCESSATLREFFAEWSAVVSCVAKARTKAGGRLIQYPKVPSRVSETLAAHLLIHAGIYPDACRIARGGGADLRVWSGDAIQKVEVKGSGESEFQTLGPKDYACDLLAWLRFGDVGSLHVGSVIKATFFLRPIQCFGDLGNRVNYRTAMARSGGTAKHAEVRIETLLSR